MKTRYMMGADDSMYVEYDLNLDTQHVHFTIMDSGTIVQTDSRDVSSVLSIEPSFNPDVQIAKKGRIWEFNIFKRDAHGDEHRIVFKNITKTEMIPIRVEMTNDGKEDIVLKNYSIHSLDKDYPQPLPDPLPVTNLKAKIVGNTVEITWINPSYDGFEKVSILRKDIATSQYLFLSDVSKSTEILVVDHLPSPGDYVYEVTTVNTLDVKSSSVNTPLTILPKPMPVTNLKAEIVDNKVEITWANPSYTGFEKVRVFSQNVATSLYVHLGDVSNATESFIIDPIPAPGDYIYEVVTMNKASASSDGEFAPLTIEAALPEPLPVTNLKVEISIARQIKVTWTNPDYKGFKGILIYRRNVATQEVVVSQALLKPVSSFFVNAPPPGDYIYEVVTFNTLDKESSLATQSLTVYPTPLPVTNLAAKIVNATVKLTWKNPTYTGFTKVNISVEDNSTKLITQLGKMDASTESFTINTVPPAGNYKYIVTTENGLGELSIISSTLLSISPPVIEFDNYLQGNKSIDITPLHIDDPSITCYFLTIDGKSPIKIMVEDLIDSYSSGKKNAIDLKGKIDCTIEHHFKVSASKDGVTTFAESQYQTSYFSNPPISPSWVEIMPEILARHPFLLKATVKLSEDGLTAYITFLNIEKKFGLNYGDFELRYRKFGITGQMSDPIPRVNDGKNTISFEIDIDYFLNNGAKMNTPYILSFMAYPISGNTYYHFNVDFEYEIEAWRFKYFNLINK